MRCRRRLVPTLVVISLMSAAEPAPTATPTTSPAARPVLRGGAAARAIGVGLAAGFLSGLFGVGGGILMVPGMVILLGVEQKRASGTSLAAVLPIALASLVGYLGDDKVDWPVAALLVAGALGGAVLGTWFLHRLPQRAVGIAFAVLLVASAIRMIVDHSTADGRGALSVIGGVALVLVGFASGVLAGLLGVGGGIVMVPAMVLGLGVPAAVAKGTSLAVIVPTAVMGTWRNRATGNADLRLAVTLGLAGTVSAYLGSKVSIGMSERLSAGLFAALLVVVSIRMLLQLRRRPPSPAA